LYHEIIDESESESESEQASISYIYHTQNLGVEEHLDQQLIGPTCIHTALRRWISRCLSTGNAGEEDGQM
jgi:hypothetical protein